MGMASNGVADSKNTANVARTAMRHATTTGWPAAAAPALIQLASHDARGTQESSTVTTTSPRPSRPPPQPSAAGRGTARRPRPCRAGPRSRRRRSRTRGRVPRRSTPPRRRYPRSSGGSVTRPGGSQRVQPRSHRAQRTHPAQVRGWRARRAPGSRTPRNVDRRAGRARGRCRIGDRHAAHRPPGSPVSSR